ncbi:MAG: hypothetical protein EBY82_04405, partial [Actinobacteria bacterium]|nr:hypothetical protein [Actinomycetota bacterium]
MSREAVTSAKRVVIKIGSSSLTGTAGSALDDTSVEKIVQVVANLKARGTEVLVVSSGAIAAGLAPLGLTTRPKDLATQQATEAAEIRNEKETDDLALAYGKGATGRGMATGGSKAIKDLEKEQKTRQ